MRIGKSQIHEYRLLAAAIFQKVNRLVDDGLTRLAARPRLLVHHILVVVEQGLNRR
jgi:hypothetical protein